MHTSTRIRLSQIFMLGALLVLPACSPPQTASTFANGTRPNAASSAKPTADSRPTGAATAAAPAAAIETKPSATASATRTPASTPKPTVGGSPTSTAAGSVTPTAAKGGVLTAARTPTATASSARPAIVKVKLDTFSINPAITTIKAGAITFDVMNVAKGETHEMVLIKTDLAPADLPYAPDLGRLSENQLDSLGEVADLKPGKRDTLSVNLKPGKYMLICNIPGHYKAGMVTPLVVTP
ncbi:MAG: cupredoxin domain-containing protein [Kouleothrix sp.]|nr:cupredoxin domain-containing protein [Kouleothrix sp.]